MLSGRIQVEIDAYLISELKTVDSLVTCIYPDVVAALMKINSTLPSSAAAERLFSAVLSLSLHSDTFLKRSPFESDDDKDNTSSDH